VILTAGELEVEGMGSGTTEFGGESVSGVRPITGVKVQLHTACLGEAVRIEQ